MARFNTPAVARGPITTTGEFGLTHEGATGHKRDAKSELFLTAVSDFSEDSFYEKRDERLARMQPLIAKTAVEDPQWLLGLVRWLRTTAHLRSIPTAIAADAIHYRLAGGFHGGNDSLESGTFGANRQFVTAAVGRADEAAEFLAYWHTQHGRKVPSAVKRGLGDAMNGLTEYSWLKWKGRNARGNFSMADVLNLTHPDPKDNHQDHLFAAVIADGYGREVPADALAHLPVVNARLTWQRMSDESKRAMLHDPEFARKAGLTHEVAAGALGRLTAADWRALVPQMGFQAVLMNLRRMEEAGIDSATRDLIRVMLRDENKVIASKMYPMRFLAAYRNAPLEFAGDLEAAANAVLHNVPRLPGKTLILVDRSGSMNMALSARGSLKRVDAANVFGAALALRAENADLVAFGTSTQVVPIGRNRSLLRLADQPANMGGTNTAQAVAHHYRDHNRVIVLTDEQAGAGWNRYYRTSTDAFAAIPDNVATFTWNLAGYEHGHAPDGKKRFTFGGLSDVGMDLILPLERGFSQRWPWER